MNYLRLLSFTYIFNSEREGKGMKQLIIEDISSF
jgi:hypothetical protein